MTTYVTDALVLESLSADEGSPYWSASLVLSDPADFARIRIRDEVRIGLYGDTYRLIVDNKFIDRSNPAAPVFKISAKSPCILLTQPLSPPLTQTWDTATLASVIAQEIADQADLAIDWQLIDWVLPANKLAVTGTDPLEVIRMLVEAAGGVLQSEPEGDLVVRHLYPMSPREYPITAADHVFTDADDNLTASESASANYFYNYVEVGDSAPSVEAADRIEFIANDGSNTSGVLRVYPFPWRENFTLHSTGDASVTIFGRIDRTLPEEETVEISNYVGSVAYPVYEVTNTEWVAADLGNVVIPQYTSDISVDGADLYGYSMLRVAYTKRFFEYPVSGDPGDISNIIMIEHF